ncbi:HK97 family phage portal protein [Ancylobacter aquaticus]|uniref:HK97 family phage portal protein n=1 Tax=Ancylobacter aquaticus TaxID=100 RepID=A0A4R1HZX5_ANCAQ|nr:phage portal protein [Ancylobacter aquaticus]TCK27988.1 HK97 family phage portal protein [Ancylobacter aquaticus]
MWPFNRPAPVETKSDLTDPTSDSWEALTAALASSTTGVTVSAESAMRCAPVNAAVTLICQSIGTLPCKVYRKDGDGKDVDDTHPAYALIHDEANEWQSAGKVRELVTADALLHGDGYAFVSRGGNRPFAIIYLPRDKVGLNHLDTGEPRYTIGGRVYTPADVIHVQAPSLGGKTGLGLLRAGVDAIGLAILLERTSASLFKNNSRPGGVLSFKSQLRKETVERVGAAWRAAHGGGKSGGIAVVDGGGEYTPIAFTSVEAQHIEQRNFAIAEIARLTRVPVTMLQELSKGTFANTEQQALQFLQLCLLPWLKAWTDAYRRTLLTVEERATHSLEFIVDDLLRADTATRAEAYAKFRAMGAMTSNDVRRRENLPALPDGDTLGSPYTTPGAPAPANDNPEPKPKEAAA